jgi:hypothetical protein
MNIKEKDELTEYRILQLEKDRDAHATRITGLELWKAKVEDTIKEKITPGGNITDSANSKDWIKIVIMALTIISALVALLTKVLP